MFLCLSISRSDKIAREEDCKRSELTATLGGNSKLTRQNSEAVLKMAVEQVMKVIKDFRSLYDVHKFAYETQDNLLGYLLRSPGKVSPHTLPAQLRNKP